MSIDCATPQFHFGEVGYWRSDREVDVAERPELRCVHRNEDERHRGDPIFAHSRQTHICRSISRPPVWREADLSTRRGPDHGLSGAR